jgi:hypothetical protein
VAKGISGFSVIHAKVRVWLSRQHGYLLMGEMIGCYEMYLQRSRFHSTCNTHVFTQPATLTFSLNLQRSRFTQPATRARFHSTCNTSTFSLNLRAPAFHILNSFHYFSLDAHCVHQHASTHRTGPLSMLSILKLLFYYFSLDAHCVHQHASTHRTGPLSTLFTPYH